MRARCPAKINLSLEVLGRRPDGYHEIRTTFQTVDLWDTIEATIAPDLTLACGTPGIPTDATNLVVRAAEALRSRLPEPVPGATIRLAKGIPAEAGLGGGSSDAAGALLLLSRLWGLDLPRETLVEVAASLGADVPFFFTGGTAVGTGRGDTIEPVPYIGELHVLLGFPPIRVATAAVYRAISARLTPPGNGVTVPGSPVNLPWRNDLGAPINHLESVVFDEWPELLTFRDALLGEGAEVALMSGSGSTVYGLFRDPEGLRSATEALSLRFAGWELRATRSVRAAAHVEETGAPTGG